VRDKSFQGPLAQCQREMISRILRQAQDEENHQADGEEIHRAEGGKATDVAASS
jgi:hypothetical protein